MKNSFRFLRSFCPPHLHEEIEGDLLQPRRRVNNFRKGSLKKGLNNGQVQK